MIGLGTLINVAGIAAGGIVGRFFGKYFPDRMQDTLGKTCGVSVIFIGIAGAMEGMLSIDGQSLTSGQSMLIVLCLVLGAFIGEALSGHNVITYLALVTIILVWLLIYKTPLGLRIRTVGENPDAASGQPQ